MPIGRICTKVRKPQDLYSMNMLDKIICTNNDQAIQFLQKLVKTRSCNNFTPENSRADEPIELDVARLIARKLEEIGLQPRFVSMSPRRPNVVAEIGGFGQKTLILNGHMDTVEPSNDYTMDPFGAEIKDGKLYGVGAADMKASLTAFIYAVKAILDSGIQLRGRLILMFVVDEEAGACSPYGSKYLLDSGLTGDVAIVGEPGSRNICIGHRGGYRFRITTFGESQHTGFKSWEKGKKGHNAILDMARIIQGLSGLEIPFRETIAFTGRRPVITFPTLIEGGTAINAVPDRCVAYGDCRLMPGNTREEIISLIKERLDHLDGVRYAIQDLLFVPSVEISSEEKIVKLLKKHTMEVTQKEPSTIGAGPWNDGWQFITRGIPAVCGFGVDGKNVHSADEFIYLNSLLDVTAIYARTIIDYLEGAP